MSEEQKNPIERDEQKIPIDINLNKLLDWLLSRRHCNRNWQQYVLPIRKKINIAIQDMPAVEEITQLLTGSYINYFHCLQIVDLLKTTEASSKNIFGQYSSQRMKDWQEIIKLYERDNIYLAETGQMLIRYSTYEAPALKKQISRCQQLQEEWLKKEKSHIKSSKDFQNKYYTSCQEIGIQGQNIVKELFSLLEDLPEFLSKLATQIKDLLPAIQYYLHFTSFILDCENPPDLQAVQYVATRGNVTKFEWKMGRPPDVIEVPKSEILIEAENGSTIDDQIDFGDLVLSESGDDRSSSSPNGDFVHVENEDLQVIETGDDGFLDIVPTEDKARIEVAQGTDALTLLECPIYRADVFENIIKLKGFLEQHARELANAERDVLSSIIFQCDPAIFQVSSYEQVCDWKSKANELCIFMNDSKLKQLLLIQDSSKYVEKLVDSLKSKLSSSEKCCESAKAAHQRYEELCEEQAALEPKLDLLIKRTKELKGKVEADISKRYKYRPVNITGAINLL